MSREFRPDKLRGNKSNKYHFDGLIKAAEQYAIEKIEMVQDRKDSEAARRKRKRPKLKQPESKK